ncbi:MAG: GGDEF domain-containing protein [Rhizobacter sp.]|nr:GGDEF domain-containing protein [Burkholderiales bacterium]
MAWLSNGTSITVGLAFGLTAIALTVVIALLARVGDWTRSLSWWVSAAFCMTTGFLLSFLQAPVPPQWAIALSNPTTVLGSCLFLVGVRHVVDRPIALLRIAPIIVASVVCSVFFVFVWPSVTGRVISQVACLGVITWLNVLALRLLDHGYYHFPARFLLYVNVGTMLFLVARAVNVVLWPSPVNTLAPAAINAVVYGIAGLLILTYLMGILLICFAEKQTLLRKLATEDALTGAHNRLGLRDALNAWPDRQSGVVTVFDIDHFKRVNDSFGHEAGDILLKTFAQSLRAMAPEGAIIARLGGDEFCVVESVATRAFSNEWIATLKTQLPLRLEIAAPALMSCKVSHGSARFASVSGEFAAGLREADRALYRSKARKILREGTPRVA